MLVHYGGLGAQIVTPVWADGQLRGIVSLHHLGGARDWSGGELALARAAAELVARLMADPPPAGAATRGPRRTAGEGPR
jgi:GAF domain-containing protein